MNGPALYELPSAPASWRIALPHTVAAVPVARALVRTALAELEYGADCDTAELLTAELVANAVEHTPGEAPIELVVELMPSGCQVAGRPTPGRSTGAGCC
jgi:anti-sigma regulatory factor (Ser/Thr protein kinase)